MSKTQANSKAPVKSTSTPVEVKAGASHAGGFVRENQKSLIFIGAAIIVMVLLYLGYQKLYLAPREDTADTQMYAAQDWWKNKEWDKAINSGLDLHPKVYEWNATPPVTPNADGYYTVAVPGVTKYV